MIALQYFVLTCLIAYDYIAVMKQISKLKARTVNFRMTDDELSRLDVLAKADDRSRSQMLRRLVIEGLDRDVTSKRAANGDC